MNEQKTTGNTIVFKVGGVPVAGETGCSLSISGSEIDMSNKSTLYWKEFLPGRSDWTASATGLIIFDSVNLTLEASQKALFTAISTNAQVDVELQIAAGLKFSGTVFFSSFEADAQDDNPATISWAVRGVGALSLIEGEV